MEGIGIPETARTFGLHRDTVRKMLAYSVPRGVIAGGLRPRDTTHRQAQEAPFTGVIVRILEDDLRRPRKQRQTAKRIFERLHDEYGFDGQYTIVKDYVREHRRQSREMFVPLSHCAGPRPVRLRRGPGGHRRRGAEGPLLRYRPAPQRRLLRQRLLPLPCFTSWCDKACVLHTQMRASMSVYPSGATSAAGRVSYLSAGATRAFARLTQLPATRPPQPALPIGLSAERIHHTSCQG